MAGSDGFIFNDSSSRLFCLDVGISDDILVETMETFFVCASSDPSVQFTTTCVPVDIMDNDGIYNNDDIYALCMLYLSEAINVEH